MENQNVLEYEIEMATLDLKGRRYREAVDKFSDLTRTVNNAGAWSGLALAKLGLITEDVTVVEVFHCLTNALNKADKKEDIYALSVEAAKEAIKELYEVYVKAILISRQAEKDAFKQKLNSLAGAFFTIDSQMSKRNTSSAIGAGLTALSYNGYLNSKNTAEELSRAAERIKHLISEIVEHTKEFNSANENEEVKDFENFVTSADLKAVELTKTEKEKEQDRLENENALKEKERQVYIEQSKHIIEDESHVFHSLKKKAIEEYKGMNYEASLNNIKKASQFFTEDIELNTIAENCKSILLKIVRRKSRNEALIWVVAIIVGSFILGGKDNNEDVAGIVGLLIFIVAPIMLIYRHNKRKNRIKAM